ncbi:DUF4136 domain-containing protein [Kaarinaea lacus]
MNKTMRSCDQYGFTSNSRLIMLFMLLTLLLACQTEQTTTPDDESQRLAFVSYLDSHFAVSASKNTVSWKPESSFIHANERINAESYKQILEDAIIITLKNKGYLFSDDPQQGDLLISYAAGLETELSDKEITQRFGMIPGLQGQKPGQDKYEKGTIILDIYDRRANKSVWRGVVQGFADMQLSPAERSKRLKNVLRQLMAEFPAML